MILGEPRFQDLLDLIEEVGCPECEQPPSVIHVNGPEEIILEGCGHVVDASEWLDMGVMEEYGWPRWRHHR